MDAEFLTQPFDEVRLSVALEEALSVGQTFHVVVAWAQLGGVSQLAAPIRALRERGGVCTAIVGIGGGVATKQGLEAVEATFDDSWVFHDSSGRLFHPKLYVIESPAECVTVVGSSNLTTGGMGNHFEASLITRLTPSLATDRKLRDSVYAYRDRLLAEPDACKKITTSLVTELVAAGLIKAGDGPTKREQTQAEHRASSARQIFGRAVEGVGGRRSGAVSGAGAAANQTGTSGALGGGAASSRAELRWWKRLAPSDVMRKTGGNQRKYVALAQAGHEIDRDTWFRRELFGRLAWAEEGMRSGDTKEVTDVPFDVYISSRYLGHFTLRVDHAEGRIAEQHNTPTYLNWSSLRDVILERDYTGWWLELSRRTDGSYQLRLSQEEP